MLEEFLHQSRIAYFSMEIALGDDIPACSGGLDVLAGGRRPMILVNTDLDGNQTDDRKPAHRLCGGDAASLHEKLEQKVLPLYAGDGFGWIAAIKGAIGKNGSHFNSNRMMRRYATEAYIR